MLKFSIRTMLALVSLTGMATFTLTRPSLTAAVALMVATGLCLLALVVVGLRKRLLAPIVIACLCCCYLVVADGGKFPKAERYLPVEWSLNQRTNYHTVFDNGRKRARSLTLWAWRVGFNENHRDRRHLTSKPVIYSRRANEPSPIANVTVRLPTLALTTANTIVTVSKRDDPQNRTYFIIGHCWFVILITMLALHALHKTGRRSDKKTR